MINIKVNKQQFISDWIVDLLVNRRKYLVHPKYLQFLQHLFFFFATKKKRNSFSENETILILERFTHFLNDQKSKNIPINAGISFIQALFEGIGSSNPKLSDAALELCHSLFKTKFSFYLTRNFDQMVKKFF